MHSFFYIAFCIRFGETRTFVEMFVAYRSKKCTALELVCRLFRRSFTKTRRRSSAKNVSGN